jgi:hypothetical protein
LLGGELPAGEDIGEPGFVVLDRDDHVTHVVFGEPDFEEVVAQALLRRHCDDLEMVRVIGRIARLADNAQCTSCHACEIGGMVLASGIPCRKRYSSVLGLDSPFVTGFGSSNTKKTHGECKHAWRVAYGVS